jgi:hypothetical protein
MACWEATSEPTPAPTTLAGSRKESFLSSHLACPSAQALLLLCLSLAPIDSTV